MSANPPAGSSRGRVLLFTGDGKGKTTAALGMGLRAFGHGRKVCVIQFIKSREDTGEVKAAEQLGGRFEVLPMGRGFVVRNGGTAEDRSRAADALKLARTRMHQCDVLILDEINCAVKKSLLSVSDVLSLIEARPPSLHIILTGRDAHPDLVEVADTVTNMVKLKHAHDAGTEALPGVEY